MTYRVFSSPPGAEEISPLAKEHLLFKELVTLDEALSFARHLSRTGRLPLMIEGNDGTRLDRRDIAAALGAGSHEQVI